MMRKRKRKSTGWSGGHVVSLTATVPVKPSKAAHTTDKEGDKQIAGKDTAGEKEKSDWRQGAMNYGTLQDKLITGVRLESKRSQAIPHSA